MSFMSLVLAVRIFHLRAQLRKGPVCGRIFGGHQAGYGGLIEKDGKTLIVCAAPLCNYEAGALNALNGHPVVVFSRTVPSRRSTSSPAPPAADRAPGSHRA